MTNQTSLIEDLESLDINTEFTEAVLDNIESIIIDNYSSNCNEKSNSYENSDEYDSCSEENSDDYETDSEADLTSDDEFDVSRDVIFTLYNNNYIPVKYIGRGTFSRAWITYDLQNNKLVAMKVIFEKYSKDGEDEIETNNYIKNNLDFNNQDIRLSQLLDHFVHKGEVCLVYELFGICVLDLLNYYENSIPIPVVKKIVLDVASGINSLHSINRVHTDLKPENILTNVHNRGTIIYKNIFERDNNFKEEYDKILENLLPENYSTFEKTKKKNVKRNIKNKALKQLTTKIKSIVTDVLYNCSREYFKDNNNESILDNISIDDLSDIENNYYTFKDYCKEIIVDKNNLYKSIRATIIDYGNCENPDNAIQEQISVRNYRPPENFLNDFFDYKADIWTLGCITFEMITGEYLFTIDFNYDDRDISYFSEIIKTIGPVPKNIANSCEYKDDFFNSNGEFLLEDSIKDSYTSIEQILIDEYDIECISAKEINSFLKNMLEYNLEKRITAGQLLTHKWLLNN